MHAYRLSGSPRAIAHLLGTIIICLLCAHATGVILRYGFGFDTARGLIPLFDVDVEGNIPTFFAVCLALSCAMLFAIIGLEARGRASRDARYWFLLAAGFLFVGYDEAFQVHERMTLPARAMMQFITGHTELGLLYYSWVVPGMIGLVLVGLFFLKFLLRIPVLTRRRMLAAGGLFVGGCIGMELIGGKLMEAYGPSLAFKIAVMVEEGLEMAGLATLVHALVSHIAEASDKVELDLHANAPAPVAAPVVQPEFSR